ncbi:MAG: hypothetical protein K6T63_06120 [Alicyclobacillus herbarius]|uniref:hypothetical protein n=1 Tax=Alicyclobacillus herbarius TaxID=122960 RepID=UPI000409F3DD|nr:hypothetical protein [Alicyclobacillus herbarius]MCL6632196.1 hypothetical protein [Alicyclobacillus herbarius]
MKKQLLLALLIIAALAAFRLHTPPDVPLPKTATVHGDTVTIPVSSHVNPKAEEYAGLTRNANHHYAVVLKSGNTMKEFPTGEELKKDKSGIDYRAGGQIRLSGRTYQADRLHVDAGGKQGYIVFKQASG